MTQNRSIANGLNEANEINEFHKVFLQIVDDLTKNEINNPAIADAFIWFKEVLQYNVPNGETDIGIAVVTSYKYLVESPSEADLKIARVLGWCTELLQTSILVNDYIIDKSLTRYGQPCWYKKENVGLTAINDACFLECCIYALLKKYVKGKPYYMSVMELFLETTLLTVTGQCLHLITAVSEAKKGDLSLFTKKRYDPIAKYKMAFCCVYLPVATAMYMAGITDDKSHTLAKTIFIQMGYFCQAQNDYLDCFGVPEILGKVGTDIEENKCGWLILRALEMASEDQKQVLKLNYGRWDKEAVQKVKGIYNDLKLEEVYKQYEERSYQDITHLINSTDGTVPKQVFLDFVNKIYKREQ